jgi:hypothetical protein
MIKNIAAAVALVAASSTAFAAEPQPFYAGLDVSSTKIDGFDREGGYGAFFGYKSTRTSRSKPAITALPIPNSARAPCAAT